MKAAKVLSTDPYVKGDPELIPLEQLLAESDVVVLCAPHSVYLDLDLEGKIVIDIWNFWRRSAQPAKVEDLFAAV